MAGVMLGVMLVIYHALVLGTREERFCFKKEERKENKERKSSHEMIGHNTQIFEMQFNILAW
jgi:hypothetical protein